MLDNRQYFYFKDNVPYEGLTLQSLRGLESRNKVQVSHFIADNITILSLKVGGIFL